MQKMSRIQRTAFTDTPNNPITPQGMFLPSSCPIRTFDAMVRHGWAVGGSVVTGHVTDAGLIAAGVDMDAIHAEALYEQALREMDDAAEEQATSRYRHFAAAVRQGGSYRGGLD